MTAIGTKSAFHVDPGLVNKGLDELSNESYVALVQGQKPKSTDSWLPLGCLALHNGLGLDLDRYGNFVDVVMTDHSIAGAATQESFILAAEAEGIPKPRVIPPARCRCRFEAAKRFFCRLLQR